MPVFGAPQLFNVTHLLDYWYGVTWNVARREIARWKQTRDEAYRYAVQAFFERTDFLRTLQHWILFYVKDSETKKSVLRQHQGRAIDAIVERCGEGKRKRGPQPTGEDACRGAPLIWPGPPGQGLPPPCPRAAPQDPAKRAKLQGAIAKADAVTHGEHIVCLSPLSTLKTWAWRRARAG